MRQQILTMIAALVFAAGLGLAPGQARAQDAWVQIEALQTLAQAEERARAWASAFPEVNGFRLSSGWYAISLGPYPTDIAADRLFALTSERLIPGDAFVADGGNYGARFWPVGAPPIAPQPTPDADATTPEPDQIIVIEPPMPQSLPDETPGEARRSEAGLTANERKDLQIALQWFGYYDAAIDGAFGRGTRGSMAAWQAAKGHDDTGVLTTMQRAELRTAYRAELDALGLGRVVETRAGIEIEMPIRLVTFDDYAPPFVRYAEKDGSGIQVLLISQEGTQATLDGLYDVMQTLEIVPLDGERERQRDSFVLTGQSAKIHSYTYARLEDGKVIGFTLIHRPEDAAQMTRAVQIMRDTLTSVGPALDPTLGSASAAPSRDLVSGLEIRRAERTRSGVYVDGQGAVLTVAEAVEGCARITLDTLYDADLVASDAGSGLALLRPKSPLAPIAVATLSTATPRIGAEAAVGGFPFGPALPAATVTFGTIEDVAGLNGEADLLRLAAETEAGDVGGPVFDASGGVAGVLLPDASDDARQLPPGVRFAAKAGVASAFLSAQGVALQSSAETGAMAPEDITEAAMGMTVLVSCWN